MIILSYILFVFYVALLAFLFVVGTFATGMGTMMWIEEDHDVDADWRPIAAIAIVGGLAIMGGAIYTGCTVLPVMWGSIG